MGNVLGTGLTRMVNDPFPDWVSNRPNNDRRRQQAIMGDPTLRLHVIGPPQNATNNPASGNIMNLSWTFKRGNQYFVYKSTSTVTGQFTRISPLLSTGSFQDTNSFGPSVYMVRAAALATSGSGSYTNLSQGVFTPSQ